MADHPSIIPLFSTSNVQKRQHRLSSVERQDIFRLYVHVGLSCRNIARHLNRSTTAVRRELSNNGVFIHSSRDWSQKYTINASYFERIDSHKKAYWLGWLMSDGTVCHLKDGSKILRIGLQARDACVLEEFRRDIDSNAPIEERIQVLNGKEFPQKILTICCAQMCIDLGKYGVVPAKSKINSCIENVPDEYVSSFILGEFEGDGCMYDAGDKGSSRFSILDTKCVCNAVKNMLEKLVGRSMGSVKKKKNAKVYVFSVNKQSDIRAIYDTIYGGRDFMFCLERKRLKLEAFLNRLDKKHIERMVRKTSRFLGVYRAKYGKHIKYCARIQVNCVPYTIGYFETELEAALGRDAKAKELLGYKAVLNFP